MLRRIILILCIVAILPTTVDPSCVRYYIYGDLGFSGPSSEAAAVAAHDDACLADLSRPTEVLAATRVPAQFSIEPHVVLGLITAIVRCRVDARVVPHAESAPAFLASALHATFLRNAVLLI